MIGTALPAYGEEEEAEDKNKFLPVWKQEVRDSEGRKRFHGAFTGGFSAGYYNTVGSKEGWTPKSFVSSASQRGKFVQNKEDFMDEEDYMDVTMGGKALVTRSDFDSFGTAPTSSSKKQSQAFPSPSAAAAASLVPADLLVPAQDPIGWKLLRKMGWRNGRIIRPLQQRTTAVTEDGKEGQAKDKQKEKEDDEEAQRPEQKRRVYGLQVSLEELKQDKIEAQETKKDEEEEEENEDVDSFMMSRFAITQQTQVVEFNVKNNVQGLGYDPYKGGGRPTLADGSAAGSIGAYGKTAGKAAVIPMQGFSAKQGSSGLGLGAFEVSTPYDDVYSQPDMHSYDIALTQADEDYEQRRRRGEKRKKGKRREKDEEEDEHSSKHRVFGNFVAASRPVVVSKWYPAPELPKDFRPIHRWDDAELPPSETPSADRYMSARRRGELLGEQQLPSSKLSSTPHKVNSVFDLMSSADRKRFEAIRAQTQTEQPQPPTTPTATPTPTATTSTSPQKPSWMAVLPASMMASRFTTAQSSDEQQNFEEVQPQQRAAAVKQVTPVRTEEDWLPVNLLCKRFNIKPPERSIAAVDGQKKGSGPKPLAPLTAILAESSSLAAASFSPTAAAAAQRFVAFASSSESDEQEVKKREELQEEEEEEEEEEATKRPPIDLFKAIFEDGDLKMEEYSSTNSLVAASTTPTTNDDDEIQKTKNETTVLTTVANPEDALFSSLFATSREEPLASSSPFSSTSSSSWLPPTSRISADGRMKQSNDGVKEGEEKEEEEDMSLWVEAAPPPSRTEAEEAEKAEKAYRKKRSRDKKEKHKKDKKDKKDKKRKDKHSRRQDKEKSHKRSKKHRRHS